MIGRFLRGLTALGGAVLVLFSFLLTAVSGEGWRLHPTSGAVAAVALVGALAMLSWAPLAVPAAMVGVAAVPALPHRPAAVLGAVIGLVAASAGREPTALVALGWAAVVVPGGRPAGVLLVSAGALAAFLPEGRLRRFGALAALPGVVALVGAVAARPRSAPGLVVCIAVGVAAAWLAARPLLDHRRPARWHLPVVALLAWLVILPTTWPWVRATGLGRYQSGALIAAGAAVLAHGARAGVALYAARRP
jgi:hypothetical protein